MRLSFTYLVKQDENTWDEFTNSIYLLEKNILSKLSCDFKILVFSEGSPNLKARKIIDHIRTKNIQLIMKTISLQEYVKRSGEENYVVEFPHAAQCELYTSLGYRDMCKFFSGDVFFDKDLLDTNYFIRVDTDSYFLDTRKKFIDDLNNLNCDYAYLLNTPQSEDKAVTVGFGKCLYDYCKKHFNKDFLSKRHFEICTEATLNPKMYYTNFEVVNLDWARSLKHFNLISHIYASKGIYNYRWGDNIIRYYTVHLLQAKIKVLSGCFYKHSGLYDSRNIFRRTISKIYSKLVKKSNKNDFEQNLIILERLLLGIKSH